ncbi:MAG: tRNA (N(6)-L-threonylcarbamoyladenosine(37)-C(2))-methylthiotransferase MtaB [Nitrospirae bacterium]|nr:MAG: tRNA (N(6)-L-threonylcarbamoyladenosine(37)-C(2))-methylthiotransferase MtaB [Nitrospirota bacterium]
MRDGCLAPLGVGDSKDTRCAKSVGRAYQFKLLFKLSSLFPTLSMKRHRVVALPRGHYNWWTMRSLSPRPRRRVTFYTAGCRLNQAETAILIDRFCAKGYEPVPFGAPTDILVINSCAVTEQAEADCRRVVRQTLRHSPQAFVAVIGCYAQTGVHALQNLPGIDLIVGHQYKLQLPEHLDALAAIEKQSTPSVVHTRRIEHQEFVVDGTGAYSTTRANVKIQDGCQFMCAFCLIPFARGRERSRALDDIIREATALAERGHRELVLTGVNIGQYCTGQADLLSVIRRLETIPGIERIRISSIEPTTIPDGLFEHMASSSKVCRHLHVPLQSGDDRILKAMNRRYTVRDYQREIERAVSLIPDLCVGTDILVGFPGEGEQEFKNSVAAAHDLPFAYVHVFPYSKRPGTAAARLSETVSSSVIKHRSRELNHLSRQKRQAFYRRCLGQRVSVLFETQQTTGLWVGFTDHYVRVGVVSSANLANTIHEVIVTGIMEEMVLGELVATGHPQEAAHRASIERVVSAI